MIPKKSLSILVIILMMVSLLFIPSQTIEGSNENLKDTSFEGSGVEEDPFHIENWTDLDRIRNHSDYHFLLKNNLTESTEGYEEHVVRGTSDHQGWTPIGDFSGTFDGDGYKIEDLYIDREEDNIGLFGRTRESATIRDIGVLDAEIVGRENTGALVGFNWGTIYRSYSHGDIEGENNTGGLVGHNLGSIEDSYTSTETSGFDNTGSFVGFNRGKINRTYSIGSVYGDENIGGLVGHNFQGMIDRSFSAAEVEGEENIGGLVGKNTQASEQISNSFWDIDASRRNKSDGGFGKTTGELTDISTYVNESTEGLENGWNFVEKMGGEYENIWMIDEEGLIRNGYPYFSWEEIIEPSESTFVISDIIIEPEEPEEGDKITIQANIKNTADMVGEHQPQIKIGEDEFGTQEEITVASKGEETFSFSHRIEEPGEYEIQIGEERHTLEVEEASSSPMMELTETYVFFLLVLLFGVILALMAIKKGILVKKEVHPTGELVENHKIEGAVGSALEDYVVRAECSSCGTQVSLDAQECPHCEQQFEDEVLEVDEASETTYITDKDSSNESSISVIGECPVCGVEVDIEAEECPGCREPFGEDTEEDILLMVECFNCGNDICIDENKCPECEEPIDV